jgi:hypothetical protein
MKALPAAQLVQLMVSHIARSPFFNLQVSEQQSQYMGLACIACCSQL